MKKISLIIPATLLSFNLFAQKADIKLHFNKGQEHSINTEIKSTMTQELMGQKMDIVSETSQKTIYKVVNENKGNYTLESQIIRIHQSTKAMGDNTEFNSDAENKDKDLNRVFYNITQEPFTITVNSKGEALDVKTSENYWENVFKDVEIPKGVNKDEIEAQFKASNGPENVKASLSNLFGYIPPHPVAVNDEWEVNSTMKSTISFNTKSTYKLEAIHDDYYIISETTSLSTPEGEGKMEQMGMEMQQDIKGTQKSTFKVEAKTGWIIEGETIQDLKGALKILPNSQVPDGMEIPLTGKTTIKYNN